MAGSTSKLFFWKKPSRNVSGATSKDEKVVPTTASAALSASTSLDNVGPRILFPLGNDDMDAKVDIVFVHGLRGDLIDTWSHGEVCWPRDLLKDDVPKARIISWGYDSNIANLLNSASKESLFGHAQTLLSDLSGLRKESNRPIIFVAHSLGGLVVKEALIQSDSYNNHDRHPFLAKIWPHTKAVIFCGTPHRGSSKEGWGEMVAAAATLALRSPNKQLLRTLKADSHILESQRNNFTTISRDLDVVCLREELATTIGLIVPESSASYDGFKVQTGSIHANHMDMVKFSTKDDGYRRIVSYIREFVDLIEEPQQEQDRWHEDDILSRLHVNVKTERDDIEGVDDDTCSWILSDGYDQASLNISSPLAPWLLSNESLFWISGKPGSGKSILMKYLHRVLEKNSSLLQWSNGKPLLVAAFLFIERGEKMQKTREGMLRSLLYQILSRERSLIATVFEEELRSPSLSTSFDWERLQKAFRKVLSECENGTNKLLLLIDGLDENRMLDHIDHYTAELDLDFLPDGENYDAALEKISDGHADIAKLLNNFKSFSNVKIIVSSRALTRFEAAFKTVPTVKVHEHTSAAISKFCRDRLESGAPVINNIQYFVREITEKSHGVFLWVSLVVDRLINIIVDGATEEELENVLKTIPQELGGKDGLYMRMIRDISHSNRCQASRLFRLVLDADRPVHIFQLFFAEEGHIAGDGLLALRGSLDPMKQLSKEKLKHEFASKQRRLKSRCAGLLEVAPTSSNVQFMHQTAKEFMSRKYVWDHIFVRGAETARFDVYLALLSGFIRLIKANPPILRGWVRRGLTAKFNDGVNGIFSDSYIAIADAISEDKYSYVRLVDELVKVYTSIFNSVFASEQFNDSDGSYFQHQRTRKDATLFFSELALAPRHVTIF